MTIRKTVVLLGAIALYSATVAGCNTVKGIGQDIQSGAQAVQNTIDYELEQSQQW